jgi:hypothetical protein
MMSSPASSSNSSVRTFKITPAEVRSLGRTIVRWREQIVARHQALVSNGPTEAVNNLIKRIKRIKRIGFGFRRRPLRTRVLLLYAGKPNWALFVTVTPRSNPMSPINGVRSRGMGMQVERVGPHTGQGETQYKEHATLFTLSVVWRFE